MKITINMNHKVRDRDLPTTTIFTLDLPETIDRLVQAATKALFKLGAP